MSSKIIDCQLYFENGCHMCLFQVMIDIHLDSGVYIHESTTTFVTGTNVILHLLISFRKITQSARFT